MAEVEQFFFSRRSGPWTSTNTRCFALVQIQNWWHHTLWKYGARITTKKGQVWTCLEVVWSRVLPLIKAQVSRRNLCGLSVIYITGGLERKRPVMGVTAEARGPWHRNSDGWTWQTIDAESLKVCLLRVCVRVCVKLWWEWHKVFLTFCMSTCRD